MLHAATFGDPDGFEVPAYTVERDGWGFTCQLSHSAKKLADSLPGGLRTVREDLEQNFRSILRGGLQKLDLVTREEFEVQEAVLARTREKLEALEKQVAELEASSD